MALGGTYLMHLFPSVLLGTRLGSAASGHQFSSIPAKAHPSYLPISLPLTLPLVSRLARLAINQINCIPQRVRGKKEIYKKEGKLEISALGIAARSAGAQT